MPAESQELKDAGLKITLPRVKILQILESAEVHHVSAEDVYKLLLANDEEIGLNENRGQRAQKSICLFFYLFKERRGNF